MKIIYSSTKLLLLLFLFTAYLRGYAQTDKLINVWFSSELLPGSSKWYSDPPDESQIKYKLDKQKALLWQYEKSDKLFTIQLDSRHEHQSILGIGMALEATTLYAIKKNKSDEQLTDVIKAFVDPDQGIGFNLFRLSIGLSDFSDGRKVSSHPKGFYSYQDTPNSEFSIQRDLDMGKIDMILRVKEIATQLNPSQEVKFFASCWSPPKWMKTSNSLIGGSLKAGYEIHLAKYFRNFIEAYESIGIPIYAITIQNEPNFTPGTYPGMKLSWKQERDIVKAIYEEFHHNLNGKKELNTELWINDHNFEDWKNPHRVLRSLEKVGQEKYVDAVAFHNYISGDPISQMSNLQKMHPTADMQITEHSEWGVSGMNNIQNYFRHQSRSYIYWVAMTTKKLDEHNQGPYNNIKDLSPTLLIENNTESPEYYETPEYYLIGQFSKFIRPGAVRINCDYGSKNNVTAVAFKNKDNSVVCVVVNQTDTEQSFQFLSKKKSAQTVLPAKTVGTYVWQE